MHGFRFAGRGGRIVAVLVALAAPAGAQMAAPAEVAVPASGAAPAEGGMRVFIEPDSGARTNAPPAALQGATVPDSRAAGLVEEVNPRGGYVIDLKRRFRGEMAAHAAPGEAVTVGCETGAAPAEKRP